MYKIENERLRQYKLNIKKISDTCEKHSKESYKEFINTYRDILLQRFPNDVEKVDNMLKDFSDDSGMCDPSMITLSSLSSEPVLCTFDEAVSNLKTTYQEDYSEPEEKHYIVPNSDMNSLFDEPKKKKRGRPSKKEQTMREKMLILEDFVLIRLNGNSEMRDILTKFLNTDAGKKYTPDQWKAQLENMIDNGVTIDRMLDGVRKSYMSGYRALYIKPQFEHDMADKVSMIQEYVDSIGAPDDRLQEFLNLYVFETTKGKSYTKNQFRGALNRLSAVCSSYEDKVISVQRSYENSYSALAYETSIQKTVDMDKKHEIIKSFINDGYYYLVDGLSDSLIQYVDNTSVGSLMSAEDFSIILENLRQFCFDDDDKVSKVRVAIQGNKSVFASEDYSETKKLRNAHESRSEHAKSLDRSRKQRVIEYAKRNPNDMRVSGLCLNVTYTEQKASRPNYL